MRQIFPRNASSTSALAIAAFSLVAVVSAACSNGEARSCKVGADCVSGMCGADGTCVDGPAVTPGDGGTNVSEAGDTDATGPLAPDDGGGLAVPGCAPNKDGTITREEVPIQAGLRATFRVAGNVELSTAGTPLPNGRRKWDLSAPLAGDTSVIVETLPLADKWYATKYANATYATRLRNDSDLIGVFETAPGSLALRGVVSPADGITKTELTYDPPVSMLQFPLTTSKTWNSETTVSGFAQGIIANYTEKYVATSDAVGELVTPLGTFEVQRVRIDLTRTFNTFPPYTTTLRTFAFITECYGTVASIASKDNEKDIEFTHAVEVRRIAP